MTVTISSNEPPNAIVAKLTRLFAVIPVPMGVLVVPRVCEEDADAPEFRFITTPSWDPSICIEVGED